MSSHQTAQTGLLLPKSNIGFDGAWLVLSLPGNPVIRLDARGLDRIGVESATLLLEVDGLVTALPIADGPDGAQQIADELQRHTRGAPIATRELAVQAAEYLEAHSAGVEQPILYVGEHAVVVRGEYLQVGRTIAFRVSEVEEYADAGANLPLPLGALLQAAMAYLVVAASERDSEEQRRSLSKRISDYQRGSP